MTKNVPICTVGNSVFTISKHFNAALALAVPQGLLKKHFFATIAIVSFLE